MPDDSPPRSFLSQQMAPPPQSLHLVCRPGGCGLRCVTSVPTHGVDVQVGLCDVCVLSRKEKCGRRLLSIATDITFQMPTASIDVSIDVGSQHISRERCRLEDNLMLRADVRYEMLQADIRYYY